MERSAVDSFRSSAYNLNSWILFLQFAGSCGVDFTMCNGTAIYFVHSFEVSIAASGAIAFLYGISAVFARGLGGWLSDAVSVQFSLQGRLYAQLVCLVLQGLLNIWFARSDQLSISIVSMVLFSILVQISMGTCFGIVPYVDGPNTGSVAGIVGAGGNVGAALLGRIFMSADYADAMEYMGWATIVTALLTPFIVVKGYKCIVFGHEDSVGSDISKQQHSPLLVPGKINKSPHLISFHARRQRQQMEPPVMR
jgi:NNP family nitrate/nitrite transporter-like MFS transporter